MKLKQMISEVSSIELKNIGTDILPDDMVYVVEEDGIQILSVNILDIDALKRYFPIGYKAVLDAGVSESDIASVIVYVSEAGIGVVVFQNSTAGIVDVIGTDKVGKGNSDAVELANQFLKDRITQSLLDEISKLA